MGQEEKDFSIAQGGRGVYARNRPTISQAGVQVLVGESPGPGTGASAFLATNQDAAYDGATLYWYVKQDGRRALFSTTTISAAENASQPALEYTQSGFAADSWEVWISVVGALPAAALQSAVAAFGVEDVLDTGSVSPGSSLVNLQNFTGPGGAGAATFPVPFGTSTWIITVTMRITAGTVGDPTGDSYTTSGTYSYENRAGVVTLVPISVSNEMVSFDGLMSTAIIPDPSSTGTQAEVSYTLPTGLHALTKTAVTVTMFLIAGG